MTPPPLGSPPVAASPTDAAPGGPGADPTALEERRRAAIARLPAPAPAAGTELFGATRGSGYRHPPSLARRADGQTIQLTPLLYAVLEAIDGERRFEQIAAQVSERTGRTVSAADVVYLTEGKLRPLGLLRAVDGTDPDLPRANPLLALRCKFVISNPAVTRRITAPFAALFRPSLVLLFLAAFVWTVWFVAFEQGLVSGLHQAFYEPHLLLLVFGLTLVSAGFHEFGHAAACRYGGATPGAMGFGLYLIWPAFYTDVTDSYRLGRGGRLRVDLGGLYFNAVFAVVTLVVWSSVRADALLLLVVAQMLQMARQLAPLVRFDGYHILADLIGVPDLFAHIKPTLLGLLPRNWRGGQHQALKPWARAVVTLWVMLVVPLLAVLLVTMVMIVPRLAATAWDALGVQWEVLGTNWADREYANVGVRILSIISLALPVLTVSYLLLRVTRRTVGKLWRASAGNRWHRAGVLSLGVVAVAALAWLWWPQGQYTPIEATERGTIPRLVAPATVPAAEAVAQPPAGVPSGGGIVPVGPPPAGAAGEPQLGLVLVPRDTDGDGTVDGDLVRIVLPGDDGDATSILDSPAPTEPVEEWPFPWHAPPPASEGDNRAVVINTEDGSTVYDVALAFVWVTDGAWVEERNEAIAYASCRDCTSVAVAFQVILVVGQSDVVIPINSAEAANYDCDSCRTHALAVQLVATLREEPDDAVLSQLGAVWAELEQLEDVAETLTLEQIYTWIKHAEARILTILASAGAEDVAASSSGAADVDEQLGTDPAGEDTTPDATPTTEPSPTPSPTTSPSPEPSSSPSPSPSPSSSPSPSEEPVPLEPSSDGTSDPTPEPVSTDPSPEPSPSPTPTGEAAGDP